MSVKILPLVKWLKKYYQIFNKASTAVFEAKSLNGRGSLLLNATIKFIERGLNE